jgi:hypothetical protein
MGIINEKVLAVTIIGVLYAIAWMLKPETILRFVIIISLWIVAIIWALDFFGFYPLSKIIHVDFYG